MQRKLEPASCFLKFKDFIVERLKASLKAQLSKKYQNYKCILLHKWVGKTSPKEKIIVINELI
jgi:hypothetical protein